MPSPDHLRALGRPRGVGWGVLLANCLAQALIAVGVLASLYAGYLNPEFRVTASQLSAVINGLATILLFALIDPQLSVMTDDVVDGRLSEPLFRRTIVWISLSRLAGTLIAQLLFVPAAAAIAWIANFI
jgi:Amj-like protein